MSSPRPAPTDRAAELRLAFDAAFAEAPAPAADPPLDLLAIRAGSSSYALRLDEIAGLHVDKPVTAVPGSPAALLGVTGLRGSIVAVHDLRVLLGETGAGPCRWMVLAAADPTVGLAFDAFERHLRVPRERATGETTGPEPGRVAVRLADGARPVVDLPALVRSVKTSGAALERNHQR